MLEELNRAAADIKQDAEKLKAKVTAFFGGDHDASHDTEEHVEALKGAVDDHVQAVVELEQAESGGPLPANNGGNPPQPQDVADTGVKEEKGGEAGGTGTDLDPATGNAATGNEPGNTDGNGEVIDPATGQPKVAETTFQPVKDEQTGLWLGADGKALNPQPEIDPATGQPKEPAIAHIEPTQNAEGQWLDAEGNVLDPQPEIDPATGKPVVAAV